MFKVLPTPSLQKGWVTRFLCGILLLSLPFWLPETRTVVRMDHQLVDFRAAYAPRAASGRFVFLAIDKQSLDQVGTWPWPRSVHAEIIDRLVAAGAADIFLDVDFSTPSTPAADKLLSEALMHAGGGVILPVFQQHSQVDDPHGAVLTKPIGSLSDNAWLAAANVALTAEGQVRSFNAFELIGGERYDSVALTLAGVSDTRLPEILSVDFSIRPDTVRTLSLASLLKGDIATEVLAGRSVVVGAYATELNDLFPVPVYGVLSGAMLHIMAAETLVQERVPRQITAWPAYFFMTLLVLGAVAYRRLPSVKILAAAGLTLAALAELAAYALQREWSLVLPTVTLHILLVGLVTFILWEKLGLSTLLAELASAERRNLRRILRRVINDSVDAVFIVDDQGRIVDLSRTAAAFSCPNWEPKRGSDFFKGAPPVLAAAVGRGVSAFIASGGSAAPVVKDFDLVCGGRKKRFEAVVTLSALEHPKLKDGEPDGRSHVACITVKDVTARNAYEEKLRRLSQFDDLTGAFSRRELVHRIKECAKGGSPMAVFVIDLHRFSMVNATLGRNTGDLVLKAVSRRLMAETRRIADHPEGAVVGRLGGDVFCVGLAVSPTRSLADYAEAVLRIFSKSVSFGRSRIEIGVRVGACLGSDVGGEPLSWIEAAEAALDQAKKVGGTGWARHTPVEAETLQRTRRLENDMRGALERGEFFLVYQPQVDLKTGTIVGAEALLRWQHPELGLVSPLEFIGIAEANGFICDLGRWVLEEACREAADWPSRYSIAVNVSVAQVARSTITQDVQYALQTSGLAPSRLHVEITESTFALDTARLLQDMTQLKTLGVVIALDDFGTGYSSLSYLADFPFDVVKVDQSFVRKLKDDAASRAIVHAVTGLATQLGMTVLCEGIEGEIEWRLLSAIGCQQGQGYCFGRPQPATAFREAIGVTPSGKAIPALRKG
ncbi:diguanylate cyclase [Pseudorhizobium endolithicum]|uniref:Diguanylate cyclase n=1 Tax=Pseudorhizobium endolithicum TaxID=1191678 RepID=A0ABN7JKD7_9HYPH|nr:diguanylate cyclase [Pseudorhizobium endolithicum]